jgi:splicing factor 3B subunit 3
VVLCASPAPLPPCPPSQDVVDGDLCEAFASLTATRQKSMAEDLGKTVGEVIKKLEDIRARVL